MVASLHLHLLDTNSEIILHGSTFSSISHDPVVSFLLLSSGFGFGQGDVRVAILWAACAGLDILRGHCAGVFVQRVESDS